ncbi:hypothetical protein [Chitinophaga silvisoli]|nr:hypothetical protein [Chitinophaga silvisoli]
MEIVAGSLTAFRSVVIIAGNNGGLLGAGIVAGTLTAFRSVVIISGNNGGLPSAEIVAGSLPLLFVLYNCRIIDCRFHALVNALLLKITGRLWRRAASNFDGLFYVNLIKMKI